MKCKCSLNNNYQIIGLCDIENFNQKINKFIDNSWTQIIIPENLIIPENFPNLGSITKVYLDIKITSTRIINTPNSNIPNIEGLLLTGKILLISGTLCQNIIYISDTNSQSIHSVKFNIPFNTYIVIDKNADIDNDKYCIYPCVEDISVRVFNKRTISKNVTLFLFAHKIIPPVPPSPPITILNKFIFTSTVDNAEITTISFDFSNKKLIVTSTGIPYDVTGSSQEAFRFELINSSSLAVKFFASINQNQDATNFQTELNGRDFEIGDLIFLRFPDSSKARLTDYPNARDTYQMIGKSGISAGQGFEITGNGVVPYILENDIILNDPSDDPVVTVQFDIISKRILVKATDKISAPGGSNYFTMALYDSNRTRLRKFDKIPGNVSGTSFATNFNGTLFKFGYFIKLEYEDNTKVVITDFPPLTGNSSFFRITSTGLVYP